jgi:hypothetical protein
MRWLVPFDGIRADPAIEHPNNSGVLQLAGLHLKQIVGKREETETTAIACE